MTARSGWLAASLAALALSGCGGEEEAAPQAGLDPAEAVEAQEQNQVRVGAFRYRVAIFRQLAGEEPGDDLLTQGVPDGEGGVYAAFVRACNVSDRRARPASQLVLQDAFGEEFAPLEPDTELAYEPRPVAPGECLPRPNSLAATRYDGAPVLFRVPFEETSERPFVLEISDTATQGRPESARIELDL